MRLRTAAPWLALVGLAAVLPGADSRPDFSGVWKLPGGALLDRRPGHADRHGIVGADVLNLARRVTLDLRAMRLTVEEAGLRAAAPRECL